MRINHQQGSYEVLFEDLESTFNGIPTKCPIITDSNLALQYPFLLSGRPTYVIPAGEASKNMANFEAALRWLAGSGATRQSTVVAFGGGVVGDLAGFVAATFMRGVKYHQIPTSLLAQVDSSVGGKVAVDLPEGKNLVGSFYPPAKVHVCLDALKTLPINEFRVGTAEIHKYAFICEPHLVQTALSPETENLPNIVRRCIEIKAAIVEADELETNGRRAILNFGHTIGHALEVETGYKMLHGEAVSIGMVAEAQLGELLGVTPPGVAKTVEERMNAQSLPARHPAFSNAEQLLGHMRKDKKSKAGEITMSLLTRLGDCKVVDSIEEGAVLSVLRGMNEQG